jgi:hypothetical protein
MGFFLSEEGGVAELAGWLELEMVVTKFEKTLTLREMIYLDGNLSSLRARHEAWYDQSSHSQCSRCLASHTSD